MFGDWGTPWGAYNEAAGPYFGAAGTVPAQFTGRQFTGRQSGSPLQQEPTRPIRRVTGGRVKTGDTSSGGRKGALDDILNKPNRSVTGSGSAGPAPSTGSRGALQDILTPPTTLASGGGGVPAPAAPVTAVAPVASGSNLGFFVISGAGLLLVGVIAFLLLRKRR